MGKNKGCKERRAVKTPKHNKIFTSLKLGNYKL